MSGIWILSFQTLLSGRVRYSNIHFSPPSRIQNSEYLQLLNTSHLHIGLTGPNLRPSLRLHTEELSTVILPWALAECPRLVAVTPFWIPERATEFARNLTVNDLRAVVVVMATSARSDWEREKFIAHKHEGHIDKVLGILVVIDIACWTSSDGVHVEPFQPFGYRSREHKTKSKAGLPQASG
ncbi:hypothetical protein K438DRAFT_1756954 [Mycena galopus ATCC 62051]|nr:hypothetical protein K438DRAFT_1756954 [Mycena galopus ATCC 62051]